MTAMRRPHTPQYFGVVFVRYTACRPRLPRLVGEADGSRAGLAAVDPDLPRYVAVTAYLHERAGDLERAAELYAQAARAATSVPERDHRTRGAARVRQLLRP